MPTWTYRIDVADVWRNDEMTFETIRDTVVARIRDSQWYRDSGGVESELEVFLDEMSGTETRDEFDGPLEVIYDLADADRCWIATF